MELTETQLEPSKKAPVHAAMQADAMLEKSDLDG